MGDNCNQVSRFIFNYIVFASLWHGLIACPGLVYLGDMSLKEGEGARDPR